MQAIDFQQNYFNRELQSQHPKPESIYTTAFLFLVVCLSLGLDRELRKRWEAGTENKIGTKQNTISSWTPYGKATTDLQRSALVPGR